MSKRLIFLTGGSGMIGFRTLVFALENGFAVRAAVRSESKRDEILSSTSIKSLNPGSNLSFVIIKDFATPGAYDQAVQGVDYIIHLASSMVLKGEIDPSEYTKFFVDTAVAGVTSVLTAASRAPSVKRIIFTSSTSAMLPWSAFTDGSKEIFNEDSRTPFPAGPYANDFEAYNAGKIAQLEVTESWAAQHNTQFDVVNVAPAYVIGRSELIVDPGDILLGTNSTAIAAVFGKKNPYPNASITAHLDDVALVHIKALETKVPSNSLWLAVSGETKTMEWNDALVYAAKRYPNAIEAGAFPNDGDQPTLRVVIDSSRTRKFFNMEFKKFESQVTSVLDHFLELKGMPVA
ncbi:NAD(P)-binding protein [Stipitochalara longipes BDJ]|nr:NAD(P)-binding protein [Stipitochalara longipes BDJ]